jgi:tetratricopeptide (TPR) repeat protein
MKRFRLVLMSLLTGGLLVLAGCESDSEKAERFFQSGLALIEAGDNERALVELRNVFEHDGFHKEARQTYADLVLEMGRTQEAYSQYLRLIEQYPDTLDARLALTRLAIRSNNWSEVERHGAAAVALAPEQLEVRAIDLTLKYRQAVQDRDAAARSEITARAEALLAEMDAAGVQDDGALVRILIDSTLQGDAPMDALPIIDRALEQDPAAEDLNMLKAQLLNDSGDVAATGAHLRRMVDLFPENTEVAQALITWFLRQEDIAGAEAFLREQAGDDTGPTQGHVNVVQLLQSTRGDDAARAELERLVAANADSGNAPLYTAMLAAIDFRTGDRAAAIESVRGAIAASQDGAQKNRLQITLAQMLAAVGTQEEADALVEQVLSEDPSNVPALRMRAARLIREDQPGAAIVALRAALDQNPRDADTLTLMAQAHERDGDIGLMGERLALAMEVADNAAPEAMRYAQFLLSQGRRSVAVAVLEDALRRGPGNTEVLLMLADVHLGAQDWNAARQVADLLRGIDTPETRQRAAELDARILQAQDRTEESLAILEDQAEDGTQNARPIILVVQAQIRGGKLDAARETLDGALATDPDNPDLLLLDASVNALMGKIADAEAGYRALVARFPQSELPVRLLMSLLNSDGRPEDARQVLDDALAVMPDQPNLLWIRASALEQEGKFEEAIAVYETIYANDTSSAVVANNLASLITTHRDDAESLTRAANIVRRLRGTDVPAFQDTYGWIAYRRGNLEEALEYLEPAASVLVEDPLAQYHLGMTYAALGRARDARTTLTRALELAGDSPLPQFDTARETLAGLPADGATE